MDDSQSDNSSHDKKMRPKLGIGQWFHYQDYEAVERTVELMADLGTSRLRTGISWADYHRPNGRQWYDWQMRQLAEAGLDVLVSLWHTPPSLAENGTPAGPPRRLRDFADFVWQITQEYGEFFSDIELWNEPNNRLKWDFPRCDPQWRKFASMIAMAGNTARMCGRRPVLGGMIPVDPHWLNLMRTCGTLPHVDVVAMHGFPEMWWPDAPNWDWYRDWCGWGGKVDCLAPHADGLPIWITETGLATCDVHTGKPCRHDLQCLMLERAAAAPVERVYWYSMLDLDPSRVAIEGYHADENEYHLGLVTHAGEKKPAYHLMKELVYGV